MQIVAARIAGVGVIVEGNVRRVECVVHHGQLLRRKGAEVVAHAAAGAAPAGNMKAAVTYVLPEHLVIEYDVVAVDELLEERFLQICPVEPRRVRRHPS